MKSRSLLIGLLVILAATPSIGQNAFDSLLSLKVAPGVNIPLGTDSALFEPSYAGRVSGELSLPFLPVLYASVDVAYNYVPLKTAVTDLSVLAFGAGVGIDLNPIPLLSIRVFGRGGYYYGFLHNGADSGGHAFADGGLGAYVLFSPRIGAGIDAGYRQYFGLGSELFVNGAVLVNIVPSAKGSGESGVRGHKPGEGLDLLGVDLKSVFPVFYSLYDDNPVGTAVVRNFERRPIQDVELTFYVKQYMDNPKQCAVPGTLAPGQQVEVPLYGLFTNRILEVSEGTKVSALIDVTYTYDKARYRRERVVTLEVQNRNAVTWDDDRRVAAFVTAKDAAILKFARNVAAVVKENTGGAVNRNLALAMGMFTALKEYGMSYAIDPTTPYSELAAASAAVDFVQFPMQSLEYKAGDCDDLSILNCALLESVGVETAFITVPGHIFMAFSLGISEEAARTQFLRPDDLVFMEDSVWVPVEITEIEGGFLKAWQTGAKEWRESAAKLKAGFYPTHLAWEQYRPVGFDIAQADITPPEEAGLARALAREYATFVEREIFPRVEELKQRISQTQSAKDMNKLGVLYAQYGIHDRAQEQFRKATAGTEYFPALLNLGNVRYLGEDYSGALEYYARADKVQRDHPGVLLGVARASHQIERYEAVAAAYDKLKRLDPALAAAHSYLEMKEQGSGRAADVDRTRAVTRWEDEQ